MGAGPAVTQHEAQRASVRAARCADVTRPADAGPHHGRTVVLADVEQLGVGVEPTLHPLRAAGHRQVRVRVDHAGHERRTRCVDRPAASSSPGSGPVPFDPQAGDTVAVDEQRGVVLQRGGRAVGERGADHGDARSIKS